MWREMRRIRYLGYQLIILQSSKWGGLGYGPRRPEEQRKGPGPGLISQAGLTIGLGRSRPPQKVALQARLDRKSPGSSGI